MTLFVFIKHHTTNFNIHHIFHCWDLKVSVVAETHNYEISTGKTPSHSCRAHNYNLQAGSFLRSLTHLSVDSVAIKRIIPSLRTFLNKLSL